MFIFLVACFYSQGQLHAGALDRKISGEFPARLNIEHIIVPVPIVERVRSSAQQNGSPSDYAGALYRQHVSGPTDCIKVCVQGCYATLFIACMAINFMLLLTVCRHDKLMIMAQ